MTEERVVVRVGVSRKGLAHCSTATCVRLELGLREAERGVRGWMVRGDTGEGGGRRRRAAVVVVVVVGGCPGSGALRGAVLPRSARVAQRPRDGDLAVFFCVQQNVLIGVSRVVWDPQRGLNTAVLCNAIKTTRVSHFPRLWDIRTLVSFCCGSNPRQLYNLFFL